MHLRCTPKSAPFVSDLPHRLSPALAGDVFRRFETASSRSLPLSDVPCRSSSTPRALPRTRAASPHASEDDGSRSLDSPRSDHTSVCLGRRRSHPETPSVVVPSHALEAHGACRAIPRPRVHSRPPHPLRPYAPCSFASTSSSKSIRASPPQSSHPVRARASESEGTSYPTFPAHILSLSKTSSFSCVSCRYRLRY